MALSYVFNKYIGEYIVENTGLVSLNYTLSKKECNSITTINTGTILVTQKITLPIKFTDGVYSLKISDNTSEELLPDILFYDNLLYSIVKNVEKSICGCGDNTPCKDCEQSECNLLLNTITSMTTVSILDTVKYSEFVANAQKNLKCSIDEATLCYLTNLQILGKQDTKRLLLNIVCAYYLAFYNKQLSLSTNSTQDNYVNTFYKNLNKCKLVVRDGSDLDRYKAGIDSTLGKVIKEARAEAGDIAKQLNEKSNQAFLAQNENDRRAAGITSTAETEMKKVPVTGHSAAAPLNAAFQAGLNSGLTRAELAAGAMACGTRQDCYRLDGYDLANPKSQCFRKGIGPRLCFP